MHPCRRISRLMLIVIVCAAICQLGCVRRRLTIRSNPPGARVYVDNYEVGTTPCSTDFIYYGTRQIRLVKDGYETLTVSQPIPTPWYEIPPLDFVSENLVPEKLHDQRSVSYTLTPQVIVPTEILLSRADGLRAAAQGPGGLPQPSQGPLPTLAPLTSPPGVLLPPATVPGRQPYPLAAPPEGPTETLPPGGRPPIYAPPLP